MLRKVSSLVPNKVSTWPIFSSQVPFEASETDLWPIFSEHGNILELVVLRNPQGRSRGCGFVIYENRMMAEKAIQQVDGKVIETCHCRGHRNFSFDEDARLY